MSTTDGSGSVAGRGLSAVREALDRFRAGSDEQVVERATDDDVRGAVLSVLVEQPSNGYRVVRVLADRAAGGSSPGAGAVYPALQLLADEGLAVAEESEGRRVWSLTDAGRAAAGAAGERAARASVSRPAAGPDPLGTVTRSASVARATAQLAQAAALAAQTAGRDQVAEVVAVIDEARRRIVSILARS